MIWLLVVVLLFAAALLLFLQAKGSRHDHLINRRLTGASVSEEPNGLPMSQWLQRWERHPWMLRLLNLDSETNLLLSRMGWRRNLHRVFFVSFQWFLPLLLLGALALWRSFFGAPQEHAYLLPVIILLGGFLLPKRLLAKAAKKRQEQLRNEVFLIVPLLRVLFDAGLTVEQSLRILTERGNLLMPVFSQEMRLVLTRVDSGLDLADELQQFNKLMEVDELSDCLSILRQLLLQGGGAMNSLKNLKKILDERRLTTMQEYISKLSGKMSAVMMVFLFPALLIVLAGPGLMAVGSALGGM